MSDLPPASIVIPVLDEAGNVASLCAELAEKLPPGFEVLFVDDGSTDSTFAELQRARVGHPTWRVLRHARRGGKSAALRTGARAARHAWIATMDGDGQNDPADLLAMLAAPGGRPALVAGARRRRRDTPAKRLASRLANRVRRAVLDDDCPDTGCGMKAFPRDAFLALPQFEGLHRFLPALFRAHGLPVINHPVNDRPRGEGRSKYTNWGRAMVGIGDLLGVMWLRARTRLPEVSEAGAP